MFNWIWRRVFSEDNIGYLVEKSRPMIVKLMHEESKEVIFKILEDEEIAGGVRLYGDALFNHYSKKLWGQIGGKQKGLNAAVAQAQPTLEIFDDEGNISISQIIRGFMSGQFKGMLEGQSPQNTPQSGGGGGNAPNM